MARTPGTYATLKTSEGTIVCRLFEKEAPKTVANFIELAEGKREWTHPTTRAKSNSKLYDGTIFHRVIPDFMIQGGDPAGNGMGGPGYKFEDETKGSAHHFDKPGKLAMANAGPNTNGSQFFIVWKDTKLSPNYTPFGVVTRRSRTTGSEGSTSQICAISAISSVCAWMSAVRRTSGVPSCASSASTAGLA